MKLKYLGKDKHSFEYFASLDDEFVYQMRPVSMAPAPNPEALKALTQNIEGPLEMVGWYCSLPAWERTMHKVVTDRR